jgi:hypothetical protein
VPNEKLAIAVYGFRSKQEYIYRTNRIKETMGASKIIEDAFDEVKLLKIMKSKGVGDSKYGGFIAEGLDRADGKNDGYIFA